MDGMADSLFLMDSKGSTPSIRGAAGEGKTMRKICKNAWILCSSCKKPPGCKKTAPAAVWRDRRPSKPAGRRRTKENHLWMTKH